MDRLVVNECQTHGKCVGGVLYHRVSNPEESVFLPAGAVIIAAGGSAFDQSETGLLAEFAPHLRGLATSSGPQADGSGIKLAREVNIRPIFHHHHFDQIGAHLVNMDRIQIHPSGFIDPTSPSSASKFLAPEALRGSGGILLDNHGVRFANELGSRGYLAEAILSHCSSHASLLESGRDQKVAYMILNQQAVETFGAHAFGFYLSKGLFKKFPNALALAEANGWNSFEAS